MSATNTSTAKLYSQLLWDQIQGPHRYHGPKHLSLGGLTLDIEGINHGLKGMGFSVSLRGDELTLSGPTQGSVELLTLRGWTKIFDGSKAVSKSDARLEWTFPLGESLTLRLQGTTGQSLILHGGESKASKGPLAALTGLLASPSAKEWSKLNLQSLVVHVLLFVGVMQLKHLNFDWTSVDAITEKIEQKTEEQRQVTEVAPAGAGGVEEGEFNGVGLRAQQAMTAEASAARAEARARAVTSGLSGLANKFANITFGGGTLAVNSGGGSGKGTGAAQSMGNGLAQGLGSSNLSGEFSRIAQGVSGKSMQLGIAGKASGNVTRGDLEDIANQFRALQSEFRDCYEKALIKDEELAVTVRYQGDVNAMGRLDSPQFDISGTSTPAGESELTGCLSRVLGRVKLSKSLQGIKVKNQFIFKS